MRINQHLRDQIDSLSVERMKEKMTFGHPDRKILEGSSGDYFMKVYAKKKMIKKAING